MRYTTRIEANNSKIIKELAEVESVHYQVEVNEKDLKNLEQAGNYIKGWPCVESQYKCRRGTIFSVMSYILSLRSKCCIWDLLEGKITVRYPTLCRNYN